MPPGSLVIVSGGGLYRVPWSVYSGTHRRFLGNFQWDPLAARECFNSPAILSDTHLFIPRMM